MKQLLLFLSIFINSCAWLMPNTNCLQSKLTLDIGSGSTKYYFARVNQCKQEVITIIKHDSFRFPFKQILTNSSNNTFPVEVQEQFINKLKKLQKEFNPNKITAVATSAFRTSKNGSDFITAIKNKIPMEIKIITQKEEGFLGYHAMKHRLHINEPVLYWDIGGGSMQMILEQSKKPILYEGKIGAVSFKDKIISKIYRKKRQSPNPIGTHNIKKVINTAKKFATSTLPKIFLKQAQKYKVFGIGGVHQYAILKNNKKNSDYYTNKELMKWLRKKVNYTDKKLKSKYAATDVTNIALVLGYMQALQIKKVNVIGDVNMAYGLLFKW